ncbi:hypothetical protein [Burkholderia cenocepacia]|uniref:hypothetical protein n=1 Tax=Burkholderia cenocepacia TaxID=95486 RepID=UPI0038CBFA6D
MSKQFKSGDKIRCINACGWGGITKGNIYEVASMEDGPCVRLLKDDGGGTTAPYAYRFELVAAEPVPVAEEPQPSTFKKGDRVKVTRKASSRNGRSFPWLGDSMDATLGTVGECTGKSYNFNAGTAYVVEFPNGNAFYFLPESLEAAPYVETAFKVGDTVRLKDQSKFGGSWGGPMVVERVNKHGTVFAYNATAFAGTQGGFNPDDLEHVPASAYKVCAIIPKARPWPETYASLEEAREAIIKTGRRGVSYEIFPYTVAETVRLVETTTRTLEAA